MNPRGAGLLGQILGGDQKRISNHRFDPDAGPIDIVQGRHWLHRRYSTF
jgi:hypothetical protein